jgi:hypothetical protein
MRIRGPCDKAERPGGSVPPGRFRGWSSDRPGARPGRHRHRANRVGSADQCVKAGAQGRRREGARSAATDRPRGLDAGTVDARARSHDRHRFPGGSAPPRAPALARFRAARQRSGAPAPAPAGRRRVVSGPTPLRRDIDLIPHLPRANHALERHPRRFVLVGARICATSSPRKGRGRETRPTGVHVDTMAEGEPRDVINLEVFVLARTSRVQRRLRPCAIVARAPAARSSGFAAAQGCLP